MLVEFSFRSTHWKKHRPAGKKGSHPRPLNPQCGAHWGVMGEPHPSAHPEHGGGHAGRDRGAG